jgi:triphosphoribosyl-dephospho-CoA synthase
MALTDCLRLACYAEVLARKPGNVHPDARFDDLDFEDFLTSAEAAAPELARAAEVGIGRAIHDAVAATRRLIATNTNLGICLLLAPCAAADSQQPFRPAIRSVLDALTVEDARWVYRAIRVASPGGLGKADDQDVADEPTVTLTEAMQIAADRDSVALQYANGFCDVATIGVEALTAGVPQGIESAIVGAHLRFMADLPDTLIARKCGRDVAVESARRARAVLDAGFPATAANDQLRELDLWLRVDGHRRNPGTSADLVAASLFVAMRWERLKSSIVKRWVESVLGDVRGRRC